MERREVVLFLCFEATWETFPLRDGVIGAGIVDMVDIDDMVGMVDGTDGMLIYFRISEYL